MKPTVEIRIESASAFGEWLREGGLTMEVKWANKKRGWQVAFYQKSHLRLRVDSGGKSDLAPLLNYAVEQMSGLLRSDRETADTQQPRV